MDEASWNGALGRGPRQLWPQQRHGGQGGQCGRRAAEHDDGPLWARRAVRRQQWLRRGARRREPARHDPAHRCGLDLFATGFNPNSNGILGKRADYLSDSSYDVVRVWNDFDINYHLYADIGNDRFNGSQSFTTNTWYHVALVFDGSLAAAQRVRLYVNGVLDGEFNESATSVPVFQTPVHVGCMPAGTPPVSAQEFIGKVDDVAVWTRALGAQEIMRLAQSLTPL